MFESIGVALRATDENIDDPFYFDIHAVIAANERRKFLERSAEGMNRAAKRRPLYRRYRPARLYGLRRSWFPPSRPRRLSHVGRPIRGRRRQAHL